MRAREGAGDGRGGGRGGTHFHSRTPSAARRMVARRKEVTTIFGVGSSWCSASLLEAMSLTSAGQSSSGSHRSSSSVHISRSEAGTISNVGHGRSAPRHARAWSVFPSPISSANSPRPRQRSRVCTPCRWKPSSEAWSRAGICRISRAARAASAGVSSAEVGRPRKKERAPLGTGWTARGGVEATRGGGVGAAGGGGGAGGDGGTAGGGGTADAPAVSSAPSCS